MLVCCAALCVCVGDAGSQRHACRAGATRRAAAAALVQVRAAGVQVMLALLQMMRTGESRRGRGEAGGGAGVGSRGTAGAPSHSPRHGAILWAEVVLWDEEGVHQQSVTFILRPSGLVHLQAHRAHNRLHPEPVCAPSAGALCCRQVASGQVDAARQHRHWWWPLSWLGHPSKRLSAREHEE